MAFVVFAQGGVPRDYERCAAVCGDIKLKCERELATVVAEYQRKLQNLQRQLDYQTDRFAAIEGSGRMAVGQHGSSRPSLQAESSSASETEAGIDIMGVGQHGRSRALLQAASSCSKQEVKALLSAPASDRVSTGLRIFEENPPCGSCLVRAVPQRPPQNAYSVMSCLHQHENQCVEAGDLAKITPEFRTATLDKPASLIRMLGLVSADCTYCLLSTIEFVCGAGCMNEVLHFWSDYPIIPSPCLPELASTLASAQAKATRAAMRASLPLGLSAAPETEATNLYVAVDDLLFAGWPVYRGVNKRDWMYRCGPDGGSEEFWVISSVSDQAAWSRCEGRVWIELEFARARMDPLDDSTILNGLSFDLGFASCNDTLVLSTKLDEPNVDSDLTQPGTPGPTISAAEVECRLLRQFGAHAADASGRTRTVRLPCAPEAVRLVGDVLVRSGQVLRLEGCEAELQSSIVVGLRRLRVDQGGRLELIRVALVDSVGSAVFSEGDLVILNSTFERCATSSNAVSRVSEGLYAHPSVSGGSAQEGNASVPAMLMAWGGAIFITGVTASVTSSGSGFVGNSARGHIVSAGGAIMAYGGTVVLEAGSTFRENKVEGGLLIARGGAVSAIFAVFAVSNTSFIGNVAQQSMQQAPGDMLRSLQADGTTTMAPQVEATADVSGGVDWSFDCYAAGSAYSNRTRCNCVGSHPDTEFSSRPTITIVVQEWLGSAVNAQLLKIVVEEMLGFPAQLLNLHGEEPAWAALETGMAHLMPEVWRTDDDSAKCYDMFVLEKQTVATAGEPTASAFSCTHGCMVHQNLQGD